MQKKKNLADNGGCGGTAVLKVSKNLCQEKTFFFSYLYSENKTKPKNHGLRRCCKTPPPLTQIPPSLIFF